MGAPTTADQHAQRLQPSTRLSVTLRRALRCPNHQRTVDTGRSTHHCICRPSADSSLACSVHFKRAFLPPRVEGGRKLTPGQLWGCQAGKENLFPKLHSHIYSHILTHSHTLAHSRTHSHSRAHSHTLSLTGSQSLVVESVHPTPFTRCAG